jgi:hypothetical protein
MDDESIKPGIRHQAPAQVSAHRRHGRETTGPWADLRLNQARIDALVAQLYHINKRLAGYKGRLIRLAEGHNVAREDFLKHHGGSELDPHWIARVSNLPTRSWKNLIAQEMEHINTIRSDTYALAPRRYFARSCVWYPNRKPDDLNSVGAGMPSDRDRLAMAKCGGTHRIAVGVPVLLPAGLQQLHRSNV